MRYESIRNLGMLLRELSEITKENLVKLEEVFESNLPRDGILISATDKRNTAALEIVRVLLKYKDWEYLMSVESKNS